jgi:hypothetical protein
LVLVVVSSLLAFPPICYMHWSSLCMLHVLPISFSLTWVLLPDKKAFVNM